MKRNILTLSAFFVLSILFTSCSGEDTYVDEPANAHSSARGSYWNGVLGVDHGNDNYEITADKSLLMNDLETMLKNHGDTVTLQSIAIVNKKASNDINDHAYMLVATDDLGVSVGIMLARGADATFKAIRPDDNQFANPKTVVCKGCSTGCKLEYLNMPGGKFPYCNESGCGPLCSKKEVEVD